MRKGDIFFYYALSCIYMYIDCICTMVGYSASGKLVVEFSFRRAESLCFRFANSFSRSCIKAVAPKERMSATAVLLMGLLCANIVDFFTHRVRSINFNEFYV